MTGEYLLSFFSSGFYIFYFIHERLKNIIRGVIERDTKTVALISQLSEKGGKLRRRKLVE